METIEKLQKIYEYFIQMKLKRKEYYGKNVDHLMDKHGNKVFKTEGLFMFTNKLFEHDNTPKVVSQSDFDEINKPIFYHGFRRAEHARNYLNDENHHAGGGHYGSGLYVSGNLGNAITYTVDEYSLDAETRPELVTKFKISEDASVIDIGLLLKNAFNAIGRGDKDALKVMTAGQYNRFKKIKEFLNSIPEDDEYKDDFIDAFIMEDPSCFATVLGFDMVNVGGRIDTIEDTYGNKSIEKCNQYIVLSRSALVISDSEKQRIEKLAEKEPKQNIDRYIIEDEKA